MDNATSRSQDWPVLDFAAARDTYATLHMWTQIVGKIRLVQSPWLNHSWHVTLYLTARGLTTSPIAHGARIFQIDFDFIAHRLLIQTSEGATGTVPLASCPVADFCAQVQAKLAEMHLAVTFNMTPNEVEPAIPFDQDRVHATYDAGQAHRLWRALLQADRVFKHFRSGYVGKCSPVHFFWGSFDLAVTRFSGRPAPPHPGGVPHLPDWVARDAYSHEVSSAGFWPGGELVPYPVFYSYAYPEPPGFNASPVRPAGAVYDAGLREFILPYAQVQQAASPDAMLLEFLQSSYQAAADLGQWNRPELEFTPVQRATLHNG